MSDLYEQYGLEMEADTSAADISSFDKKEPAIPKKKGGVIRSVIALTLGIVIGVGASVGAIAGGGYYLLNSPAGSTLQTIGGYAGFNYEEQIKNKFLSEEYEDKSLLDIGKELASVIKDKNLVGLNNIVPSIGEYLDTLVNNMQTEFGVTMDTDTIISTPIDQLPAYLGETFRVTPLGSMLMATSKADSLEPILMEICYGEEGLHYYIDENGDIVMNEGYQAATFETLGTDPNSMINKISLAAVLPPKADDALMLSMTYGKENVTFALQRDENGTPIVDEKGHAVVTMLPLFYTMKDGSFYDHNDDLVDCQITEAENGFVKMIQDPAYNGDGEQIYYLKADADGKYYAYVSPADDAKQMLFKKTMIGDLSANSTTMINNICLKDALNIKYDPQHPENDPHPILFSLAYGMEGVDYIVDSATKEIIMLGDAHPRTIGDLRARGTDLINDITISDIMQAAHDDALGMYLLYGKKDIHYTIDENDNLVMLQQYIAISEDNAKVYNEYGEVLEQKTETTKGYVLDVANATYTDRNGIVYTYEAASPAKTIQTRDGQMSIYYLYKDGQPANFTKHSLGELAGTDNLISRLTDRLTLSEILHSSNLEENKFLKHVSHCTVNEIPDQLLDISITDMFSDEIYGAGAIKYEGDEPLNALEGQVIAYGDYYFAENGGYRKAELKSTWKYLLTDPTGVAAPSAYKAALHMNDLISNMTTNVQNATLRELKTDGIIAGLSDSMLDTPVISGYGSITFPLPDHAIPGETKMGDLTVTELLEYTGAMSQVISKLAAMQ